MMNRRSILSTLCTGALALLAPVVAWAGRRKNAQKARWGMRDGVTDWRYVDWSDENATLVVRASYLKLLHKDAEAMIDHQQTILQLRALLAEARERLREDHYLMAYDDGEPAQMGDAFRIDHGILIARIDDALKGNNNA